MECLLQRQAVISLWRREAYHLHRPHRHHRHTYQWTTMQFLTCRLTADPTTQRPTTSSARWSGRVSSPRRLWSPRLSSSRCQSFSSSLCVLVCTDKVLLQSFCASGSHATVTHTHPFDGPFSNTRKVKPIWILLKQETVSGSGISWAICKSASRSRQITMPVPHHSDFFYRPDALPASQPTASKHWRQ